MGYSNIVNIENIIAQSLTTANAATVEEFSNMVPLNSIGNTIEKNTIPIETVNSYITLADSEIDSEISALYTTPLKRIVDLDTTLSIDAESSSSQIKISMVAPLQKGDCLKIINKETTNVFEYTVANITNSMEIELLEGLDENFIAGSRVVRVYYPRPIVVISARRAAAYLYDKYFSGENNPNETTFGAELRKIAQMHINSILNGQIVLNGQHRIGRRFYNSTLIEQYGLKEKENLPNV